MKLFKIIQQSDSDQLCLFLEKNGKADLALPDSHWTLLHHAVFYGEYAITALLLEYKARLIPLKMGYSPKGSPYPKGTTALDIARSSYNTQILGLFQYYFPHAQLNISEEYQDLSSRAYLIAGKQFQITHAEAKHLLNHVTRSIYKRGLPLTAFVTTNFTNDDSTSEKAYTALVGVLIESLTISTNGTHLHRQKSIQKEIISSRIKSCWIRSMQIPQVFWKDLELTSHTETQSKTHIYLSVSGSLRLARLHTPDSDIIEASPQSNMIQLISPVNGSYILEAWYT